MKFRLKCFNVLCLSWLTFGDIHHSTLIKAPAPPIVRAEEAAASVLQRSDGDLLVMA